MPLSKRARAESRGWSYYTQPGVDLYRGDCLEVLPALPDGCVDAVITDPPYPEISRPYGRMTEAEWFTMMRAVVPEVRRVLKPSGSAVFVLQPNSERLGRMRTWLWEFMLWVGKEWGIVQDVWWWNPEALPLTANDPHRLRSSLKACVWTGAPDCYRDVSGVLWIEADNSRARRLTSRCLGKFDRKSATRVNVDCVRARSACERRGGTQAFNVILCGPDEKHSRQVHGARTPLAICSWWVHYICPPGGVVLDPFSGSGTVGLAALKLGRRYVGVELNANYFEMSCKRLKEDACATL